MAALGLLLALAGRAGAAPDGPPPAPAAKGDPLAALVSKLGMISLAGEPRSEDLLYGCAEVPACAGPCAESLGLIGDGRTRSAAATLCPDLRGDTDPAAIRRKAEAYVRRRLSEAAARTRGRLGPADRDRLDCGLARLRGEKTGSPACDRADARALPGGLANVAQVREPESRARALAALCAEIGSCGRGCVDELKLVANVAWSELGRVPANPACPLSAVLRGGPPGQAGARARDWVTERLLGLARGACSLIEAPARPGLSCTSVAAGLTGPPGVCGDPGGPCPPRAP